MKIIKQNFSFLHSESLTIGLLLEQRWLIFKAFRGAEVQKSAREFSHGLDLRFAPYNF